MAEVEKKLDALGLVLPAPLQTPPGIVVPFSWLLVRGNHVFISGHIPTNDDGSVAAPLGKVGADVSIEQAAEAARQDAVDQLTHYVQALVGFFRDHVWTWGPAWLDLVETHAGTDYYRGVAQLTRGCLQTTDQLCATLTSGSNPST